MKLNNGRLTVAIAFLGFWSSAVFPSDSVIHGTVLAEVNKHGHLVMAVDRFVGPGQPEDGIADVVFVFAGTDETALRKAGSFFSVAKLRLNLEYGRDVERSVLKVNVPSQANYWFVVEAAERRADIAEQPRAESAAKFDGLALAKMDVKFKSWTMAQAIDHYRDFDILGPGPTGNDDATASASPQCLAGGYCSTACGITIAELSCNVTCPLSRYSCCSWNGCRCYTKTFTDPF